MEPPLPLCEVPSTTANEFLNWKNKHLQPSLTMDEYERYCNSERLYERPRMVARGDAAENLPEP
ncbi:hypothetical protein QSH57_004389, partial [Fusarium oxysporum f. sp. vasinfectum]